MSEPVLTELSAPVRTVRAAVAPPLGPKVSLARGIAAVAAGQLGRVRVARGPLLFVATVQSLGIAVLLRGVVHHHDVTASTSIVAGSTVLVVAFVALNLLAQRFGALRAAAALDYYAALPVPPAAVVLGTAVSYATFTVPGALVTAVVGAAMYDLPFSHLWMVVPVVAAAAVALSGVGALLGLALPRPELATVAGQLGMTVVLFLGIIPPSHLPLVLRAVRDAVPGTLAVDALAAALRSGTDWTGVIVRLAITIGYGAVALAAAGVALRRGGGPVSSPQQSPSTTGDWQRWDVARSQYWPTPAVHQEAIEWRREGVVATFVAAYCAVLGAGVGLIWPHVAPHIGLVRAINGSEAASKALLGDDIWLAGLGIAAAALAVALLALAGGAGAGPGGIVGLAVGGLLGMVVAAQIGHVVQEPHIRSTLTSSFPGITHSEIGTILGYFGWKVRAKFVLFAWPIAAVALQAGSVALQERLAARRLAEVPDLVG